MYKGSLKNFFLAKTAHRIPKIVTLAVSSTVLVAMINIDASASAFGGRDSNSVRSDVVLTLASESNSSQFAGLVKRWSTVSSISPTTLPITTVLSSTPTSGSSGSGVTGDNAGASGSSGSSGSSSGGSAPTTTTTDPPTTTTTSPAPSTDFPIGTADGSDPSGYAPPSADALSGYSQTYVTQFTGSSLPSVWDAYEGQPGGDPGAQMDTDHVVVGGGILQIETYEDPNNNNEWVTGGLCLCGLPGQTYGAYFVRSRVTSAGPTAVELLWPDGNVWPPEIDFNESGGSATGSSATVHFSSANSQISRGVSIDMTQWHTWGVIWTPTSITYTVDGNVWGTVTTTSAIPDIPMHISLQTQTYCSSGWACPTAPSSMDVDWVAEYAANS